MTSKKEELFDQLRRIFEVLKKYKIIISVSVVLLAVAGGIYAAEYVPNVYQSTSKIYVRPHNVKKWLLADGFETSELLVEDCIEITQTESVLQIALARLGLQEEMTPDALRAQLYVYAEPQSRILSITVSDIQPQRARDIANAVCDTAIERYNEIIEGDWAVRAEYAESSDDQIYPIIWKVVLESAVVIFAAIFLLIVIICSGDPTIKNPEDVEKYLKLSVLGVVSAEKEQKRK